MLFLRFLCPAIVGPDALFPDLEFTPVIRRTLILVAKVMQNLMNGVEFGEKETFLAPMNVILQKEKNYAVDLKKKLNVLRKRFVHTPYVLHRTTRRRRSTILRLYSGAFLHPFMRR